MPKGIDEYTDQIKAYLKDPATRLYVIGGAVMIASLLYAFLVVVPAFKGFVEFSGKARGIEKKMRLLNTRVKSLADLDKKLGSMKDEDKNYGELLPYQKDFPELLDGLASIAKESGVTIQSIIPGQLSSIGTKKEKNKYFKVMLVAITAKSGYHQLGRFISNLEQANRFISLDNLQIAYNKKTPRWHNVRITLKTYVSIED